MSSMFGAALAIGLLGVVATGVVVSWRQPFIGIGLLVAGMAFHSFVLMGLIHLGTPWVLIRLAQAWKELVLFVLVVAVARSIWLARGDEVTGLIAMDWIAIAFAAVVTVYFGMPSSILHSGANLSQRLVGFRIAILIPLVYLLGRRLSARNDHQRMLVVWLILGSAAAVTLFGIFELFLIPTRVWLDWGINQYTAFLGFKYQGPAGLPENFFLTLPNGTLVRRMVSTYISPLGIAYTALLVFPMAVAVMDRRVSQQTARWIALLTTLLILGVVLSITRLALIALAGEGVLLLFILRRAWIASLVPVLVTAGLVAVFPYTSIAPAVDRNLGVVDRVGRAWAFSGDSSTREHYGYLIQDLKFDVHHPLGLGTGASTVRYGEPVGTGESAVLGMFGDLGLIGGGLYVALYLLALWSGWRALRLTRRASLEETMPLIAFVGGLGLLPITMTSDVWGDLSVTFLFWWAAGASATLARRSIRVVPRENWHPREERIAA